MSYSATLENLRAAGNFRSIPADSRHSGLLDFSLNDYLGLGGRADLQQEFFEDEDNRRIAMTSSAARLLAALQDEHAMLETTLSGMMGGRPCLLFNSGYHANTGLISALASEAGTLIVADKLVHASIIDGIKLSGAPFQRFIHNDFNRLERILAKEHGKWDRIIVVVESIYSMDGDSTDLDALIDLKRRYPSVMLYVDEAHAFGVLGPGGAGMARGDEAYDEIDIVMGTFGKACASAGAFAAMSSELRDYAVNRSRSFIFSTALPPMMSAWSRFMLDKIVGMDAEREHLQMLSARISGALGIPDVRYILPRIIGSAEGALNVSHRLLERGVKVLPIRTPTVPAGTERLRISLSASMTVDDVDRLTSTLNEIANEY